ncbi:transporter substrate-binding domain-containing protein [Terasakiella sp. A23]|uniref:substrate-binding periplasmic protein n=1 Tax=Terasakiella sp. FCG-A23 TaxID=3080561 RepID=UPI00295507BD|nr:transporter substrate-binding domain-containing protein [Terasakiella sp. A23]MDV7339175.1 transporter substrate-binding domain-containing protein [Terasakiella sp. A23]
MLRVLVFLFVLLWGSGDAEAETNAENDTSVHFVSLAYPPFIFEKAGRVTGVASDLVREISRRLGLKAEITILPWARSLSAVKSGKADGIFTIFRTPEREKFLNYVDEVLVQQDVSLFVRYQSLFFKPEEVAETPDVLIGLRRAVNYGAWFSKQIDQKKWHNISYANSDPALLRKLVSARVDVVPMNRHVAYYHMEDLGVFGRVREIYPSIERVDSFVAFSKVLHTQSIADMFARTLRDMKRDGSYREIVARWFID